MNDLSRERPSFSNEWLIAVLDTLSEGMISVDEDGRVTAANPAAEELLGFQIAERRFDHWQELAWAELVREDRSPITATEHPVALSLADGKPRPVEVVGLPGPDGITWLALATHVLPDHVNEAAGRVIVSFQDHTMRVRAEHERQQLVEVMREFMVTVAHDLRSPLVTIVAFSELLATEWQEMRDEDRDNAIAAIVRQSHQLSRLAGDLAEVAHLEAGGYSADREKVGVRELIDLAIDGLAERPEIEIDVPEDLVVRIDRDHGRRIVLNLVENALKYGEPTFRIRASRDDRRVTLVVSDEGPGVDTEFVPRLFERFTRSSRTGAKGGTGLGLAIVSGLAALNGGSVRYEGNDPTGSCFVLEFPAG